MFESATPATWIYSDIHETSGVTKNTHNKMIASHVIPEVTHPHVQVTSGAHFRQTLLDTRVVLSKFYCISGSKLEPFSLSAGSGSLGRSWLPLRREASSLGFSLEPVAEMVVGGGGRGVGGGGGGGGAGRGGSEGGGGGGGSDGV